MAPQLRLDRALRADLARMFRSRAILAFLVLEVGAAALFVVRRGAEGGRAVALVWAAMAVFAFLAWWAGRHDRADPVPRALPDAGARLLMSLVGVTGFLLWTYHVQAAAGVLLVIAGIAGWLAVAVRAERRANTRQARGLAADEMGPGGFGPRPAWRPSLGLPNLESRPFLPIVLLVVVPRLVVGGPAYVLLAVYAIPGGIGQEVMFLIGLFAPLEAVLGRTDRAAVLAALAFALIHVPFDLPANGGDWLAASANAVFYQGSAGLIFCLAYVRHRAAVPLGAIHGAVIA